MSVAVYGPYRSYRIFSKSASPLRRAAHTTEESHVGWLRRDNYIWCSVAIYDG